MLLAELADRLSVFIGRLTGWLFFFIGVALTYDVIARFLFHSPTSWAADVSTIMQIWVVYAGMAYVLKERNLIRITAFVRMASPFWRKVSEALSLLIIGLFSAIMLWESIGIVVESIEQGRRAATMIETPSWIPEIAIPIGFGLLLLQVLADLVRLPGRPAPEFDEEEV
ncbi:MAG: TRAP transporter small permease [Burkholderiaceae bacterium]|nr:TRAP transporter small permease [Burkholderiaceae bacterium]